MEGAPLTLPQMLVAFDFQLGPTRQIVIAGEHGAADTMAMLQAARKPFQPHSIVLFADGAAGQKYLAARVDLFNDVHPLADKATAYVCQNFVCHLPTTDPAALRSLVQAPITAKNMPTR